MRNSVLIGDGDCTQKPGPKHIFLGQLIVDMKSIRPCNLKHLRYF